MDTETEKTPLRTIIVSNSEVEIARIETALFLRLPDGREGVQWAGAVFPVLPGDRIEETGEAAAPSECLPYELQQPSWRVVELDQTGEAYLFVDGTAFECETIVRRLRSAGISVERSGPNLSGEAGDWFIRLSGLSAGARSRLTDTLLDVLKADSPTVPEKLREHLLSDALQASLARQEALAGRLRDAQARSTAAKDQVSGLLEEIASLRRQISDLGQETAELRAAQIAPPPPQQQPRELPRQVMKLQAELVVVTQELLPRVDLIRGSLHFIAVELSDRRAIWRVLAELEREGRGIPVGWKAVSGRSGWWERHFSTGQDNQGRIYARLEGSPARWKVLVSHKQQQDADIRNLPV